MSSDESQRFSFQATEEILRILETSKKNSEKSIDSLPGIFVISTDRGSVLRSNDLFTSLFAGGSHTFNIFDSFDETTKNMINKILAKHESRPNESFDLEITLNDVQGQERSFFATVSPWSIKNRTHEPNLFFTLIGRDVTEVKEANERYMQLKRELASAQQVQEFMLPEQNLELNDHKMACRYLPASECGGDFLFYDNSGQGLRIWAGDVTGHGVGPAMISGAMRSAISFQKKDKAMTPAESVLSLNECLIEIAQHNYWMTFQVVDFDFKKNQIDIASAGHPSVYKLEGMDDLESKGWRDFKPLDVEVSSPIGSKIDMTPSSYSEKLTPNTLYLCFTDGLVEALNKKNEPLNYRRAFGQILKSLKKTQDPKLIVDDLMEFVSEYIDHRPLDDDISIWVLNYQ